ncbi:MAG: site-specific integrase [Acidobacteriaceae bacterium]|nr:site-specific integrase [Acidobacteriaceae bacterium]
MIESVSHYPSVHMRHRAAPLLRERDEYLTHLLEKGLEPARVRCAAAFLVHIVNLLALDSLREVEEHEIEEASKRWVDYRSPQRRKTGVGAGATPKNFVRIAKAWLNFHGCLALPSTSAPDFDLLIEDFRETLTFRRGLSSATVLSYTKRTQDFLRWASSSHSELELISMDDVDRFLLSKRAKGWQLATIATQCQALRTFFGYAEERGWCRPGMIRGIVSPRVPKYTDVPKGPSWTQVRQLIRPASGSSPQGLRARAMLLLYSIYALRSSEVSGLRLEDFDWRNETFTVRRAKRGGIQQFPIQYEVGEAILDYLKRGRPRCSCRYLFLSMRLPYGPIGPAGMWGIVAKRLREMDVDCEHVGPHSLRHACATRLLKKGSSLKEIAEYLGHQDTRSVGIYAKYDKRSLHKVAAFSLGGIR